MPLEAWSGITRAGQTRAKGENATRDLARED